MGQEAGLVRLGSVRGMGTGCERQECQQAKAKAGTEGRLFGSVTSADVATAVQEQTGIEFDRRKLHLDEPIKSLGTHQVPARLHPEVEFVVTVEVVSA